MRLTDTNGVEAETQAEQAYILIREKIVRLDFAPGDVLREDDLRDSTGLGRTPIREALQRLQREYFVNVIPRRGMFVSGIEVEELSLLFETRAVLEPYTARLAALRGTPEQWDEMETTLGQTANPTLSDEEQLGLDRRCHEIIWAASGNRFLWDTLDMLYAQSDRLWHLYLTDVADMQHAVDEHQAILSALRAQDGDGVATLVEQHVRGFDTQIRTAVTAALTAPLDQ
jgi:DNA-binding GntR family transcriptional regulator